MNISQFSGYKSCTNFVGFIPKYFIFFENCIVTYISISICQLHIFYILTYSVNLLNPPTNSRSFFLNIFIYIIMSSVNIDSFISFCSICMLFIFFSCLSTVLSRSSKSKHPCLVSHLGMENIQFFIFSYIRNRCFILFYQIEEASFHSQVAEIGRCLCNIICDEIGSTHEVLLLHIGL